MALPFPLEILFMGIFVGAVYGVTGVGLSLIFTGIRNIINLAQGSIAVLAAYLAYTLCATVRLDPLVCLAITLPTMFLIGYWMQYTLLNKIVFKSPIICLLVLIGFAFILQNAMILIWKPDPQSLAKFAPYVILSFAVGSTHIPVMYLIAFCISTVSILMTYLLLKFTYTGRAIRAASEDPEYCECLGVNTRKIYAYTFGLATALAAIAGTLIGLLSVFDPSSGMAYTVMAFGTIVLGGLGSMRGALLGGIILGVVQQFSAHFVGAAYQIFISFVVILLILTFRPEGIFGHKV